MRWEDLPQRQYRGSPRRSRRRRWRRFGFPTGGARRARHRHHHGARPRRLGARHRSAHLDRRRRDGHAAVGRAQQRAEPAPPARPARRATRWASSSRASSASTEDSGSEIFERPASATGRRRSCCSAARRARTPAAWRSPRWGRSIVRPTSDLSRHLVLPRHRAPIPRLHAGRRMRVRAGLCDRARGRPSRAEPARHPAKAQQAAARPGRRPRRTASRCGSSCRPIASPASGPRHRDQQWKTHRAGRHRSRDADRGGDRRRPAAETGAGLRRAGLASPTARRSSASAGSRPG